MKNNYITSGREDHDTIFLKWHINTQCQYRCDYCYFKKSLNKVEPTGNKTAYVNVLKRVSLKTIPKFNMDLLGGEPTLHDDIDIIIKSLCMNNKCNEINLHTNMVRSIEWYSKYDQQQFNKLKINGSYHPQYEKSRDMFVKTSVEVNKFKHVSYVCNINIYEKMWREIKAVIIDLLDHGVPIGLQMLSSVSDVWNEEYTDEFVDEFNIFLRDTEQRYGVSLFRSQDVKFTDKDNNTTIIDDYNVRLKELDIFYGWSCKATFWDIQPDGSIRNGCTGEPLLLNNKNISECVTCPLTTGCPCTDCYNFYKHE